MVTVNTAELTTEDNQLEGNRLIYKNRKCHCKIVFKGTGSSVEIGENVTLPNNCILTIPNNCTVRISDNVSIVGGYMLFSDNCELFIDKNVRFRGLKRLRLFRYAEAFIGANTTIGGGYRIRCAQLLQAGGREGLPAFLGH